ncbi:MAG: toll/interleukin-1 receptor domain-containing protein [Firmicutes bacterium]|nr:toll/interleukin-1 receptor domain-containing protein [Bacillota bacterium]
MAGFQYDAFLSYRHKPLDGDVTQRVLRFLEGYRLPGSLREKGGRGIQRVFRDTEELPVSRILSNTIENALQSARCLVVICSPATPESEWVDREVATFIELGKAESVYPLLIDGTPEESFPPSLKQIPGVEQRIMDARTEEKTAPAIMKRASSALLRVVARVAGCAEEDLRRAEHLRRRKTVLLTAGIAAALFLVVAAVCGSLWQQAERYKQITANEQQAAMEVLSRLTYGLPDRLAEQPGLYPQVAEILSDNAAQIQRILELTPEADKARVGIAENKEKLATALLKLGRHEEAEAAEKEALEIYEALSATNYLGSRLALASARNNLGRILTAKGAFEEADALYQTAAEEAGDEDPALRAAILGNLGRNLVLLGRNDEAVKTLEECRELLQTAKNGETAAEDGGPAAEAALTLTEAMCDLNLGLANLQTGEYQEAEALLRDAVSLYDEVVAAYGSRTDLTDALHAHAALGDCLTRQGREEEAEAVYAAAMDQAERLAEDRTDQDAQVILGELYNNYALCLNQQGRFAEAEEWYRRSAEIREAFYEAIATPQAAADLAQAYYNLAENAFKLGHYGNTADFFRACLDLQGPVAAELGDYQLGEYLARLAYYEIIVERDYGAAAKAALQAYEIQPDSAFVLYNLGYALLMDGREEDGDLVFRALASLGEGAVQTVRLDFAAMEKAGIYSPHMPDVLTMMEEAAG